MKRHTHTKPVYPLSPQLAKAPIYMMMQVARLAMSYRIAVDGRRTLLPDSKKTELRFPHYVALTILSEQGAISQKELSRHMRFDASDLVTIIDDLEKHGYAQRERDTSDRRRYKIRLTPNGQRALEDRNKDTVIMTKLMFAPLSPAELASLTSMLQRLDAFHQEHFDENVQKLLDQFNKIRPDST